MGCAVSPYSVTSSGRPVVLVEQAAETISSLHWTGQHPHLLGRLAVELSSFVGRRKQLSEVKRLLTTTRLLTLTGSGGAGKTRLALRAAAEMSRSFPASSAGGNPGRRRRGSTSVGCFTPTGGRVGRSVTSAGSWTSSIRRGGPCGWRSQ